MKVLYPGSIIKSRRVGLTLGTGGNCFFCGVWLNAYSGRGNAYNYNKKHFVIVHGKGYSECDEWKILNAHYNQKCIQCDKALTFNDGAYTCQECYNK